MSGASRYHTIVRPVVTEKALSAKDTVNQFVFEVAPGANKIEIKRAVESLFKVKVEEVRVVNVRGKMKRQGRNLGKRPNWKKAFVRLRSGDKIEIFEGV